MVNAQDVSATNISSHHYLKDIRPSAKDTVLTDMPSRRKVYANDSLGKHGPVLLGVCWSRTILAK